MSNTNIEVMKMILDRLYEVEVKYGAEHRCRMTMGFQLMQVADKIDLYKLLAFRDEDFIHDMTGINAHVIPESDEFQDCFLPRCSK